MDDWIRLFNALDLFSDYSFIESTHQYKYKNKPVAQSVTGFISKFAEEFDSEYWSKKKAKERSVSQDIILEEWKAKGDASASVGTQFHAYMEHSLAGKYYNPYVLSEELNKRIEILTKIGDTFLEDIRHKLIPVKTELIVGYNTELAGQVDALFYNKKFNEFQIWDWKTNKEISKKGFKGKRMLSPFTNLQDCNFVHYSLQLATYKSLLQIAGANIGRTFIVHFDDVSNNFIVYPTLNLDLDIPTLLDI